MRVPFDQSTPAPLKQHLPDHQVQTAFDLGSRLTNGELLAAAEGKFDVFVTCNRNLQYQQALAGHQLFRKPSEQWTRHERREHGTSES